MMRQAAITLFLAAAVLRAGQEPAPDWVKEAASRSLPAYPPEVHTAQLVDDEHLTVAPDGSTTRELREAVRILAPEGRKQASAFLPYFKKYSKIRDFKAWLISADGSTKTYGKNEVADVSVQEEFELYADLRAKEISAQNATPGSTFVWSAEVEEHPNDPQEVWTFQRRDPVMMSRFVLTLPPGWEAKAVLFNHDPMAPIVDGTTYTWELKNLDYIKREEGSPSALSMAPWMGVTYYATANANAPRDWRSLAMKETALDESQMTTSPDMAAEVHTLTASSSKVMEQIRAVSKFVQQIKYVAIETNLAHGGGSIPHAAADVFAKRYGDCKDKANLMRTMLRQIGVDSYMIVVYYGDRNHVHPEWAGDQFNHMILAIKVPDDTFLPAVMTHPALGKLLIFDATDPFIPLGLIPEKEQGSYGLLLAGDKGGIIQLPFAPPETNRTLVTVNGTLSAEGILQAQLDWDVRADDASMLRALREERQEAFGNELRGWLQRNVRQLASDKIDAKDSFDAGEMDVHFDFTAPRYAQSMQGRMLVLKPSIVQPYHDFPLQSEPRKHPLVLDSEDYHKEVHVKLPDNFTVDEMPPAASFTASFGKYTSECKLNGNELVFTEELEVSPITLAPDKYKEARNFFAHVAGAEGAPLVLVKN